MSYLIATSSTSDLPRSYLEEHGIPFIPYSFTVNDQPAEDDCREESRAAIYAGMRKGDILKTSMINEFVYLDFFKTLLDGGIPAADFVKTLPVDVKYDSDAYNNNVKYVQSYILAPQLIDEDNLQLLVNAGLYKWDSNNKYLESVN